MKKKNLSILSIMLLLVLVLALALAGCDQKDGLIKPLDPDKESKGEENEAITDTVDEMKTKYRKTTFDALNKEFGIFIALSGANEEDVYWNVVTTGEKNISKVTFRTFVNKEKSVVVSKNTITQDIPVKDLLSGKTTNLNYTGNSSEISFSKEDIENNKNIVDAYIESKGCTDVLFKVAKKSQDDASNINYNIIIENKTSCINVTIQLPLDTPNDQVVTKIKANEYTEKNKKIENYGDIFLTSKDVDNIK